MLKGSRIFSKSEKRWKYAPIYKYGPFYNV